MACRTRVVSRKATSVRRMLHGTHLPVGAGVVSPTQRLAPRRWVPGLDESPDRAKVVRRSKVLAYETMRDNARRMWDKPPFLLGGAQAQHGAVGSEVLIRDIPGLSGIRPGNPILAGATSFARGSDQKERVACESCVQGTVCRNRFRSPSSPDGRVGLGVSRIRLALSHLVSHPKTFGRAHGPAAPAHRGPHVVGRATARPDTRSGRRAYPLPMGRALPRPLSDADRGVTAEHRESWLACRDLPACDVQRVAVIANRTSRASATSLTHALLAGWRMRAAAAAKRASSGREYRAVSRMLTNSPATPHPGRPSLGSQPSTQRPTLGCRAVLAPTGIRQASWP